MTTPETPNIAPDDHRFPSLLQRAFITRRSGSSEVTSPEQAKADTIFVTLHKDMERFLRGSGQQARESLGLQILEPGEEAQVGNLLPDNFGRGFSLPIDDGNESINVSLFLFPHPDTDGLRVVNIRVEEIAGEEGYLELDGHTGYILRRPRSVRLTRSTPTILRRGDLADALEYRNLFDFLLTLEALAAPRPF